MAREPDNNRDGDHYNALPTGYRLHEYRLDQVLGVGGFGITYLAWDENLNKRVAIKEYLPAEFAVRAGEFTVQAKSTSDRDDYQWGLDRFMEEAQMLARFHHPNIVQVFRFFPAHGTAYMVMNYEEGQSFAEVVKRQRGIFDEEELLGLVLPLLDGLGQVHAAKVLHRDIKPGNIYIRHDGSPVLLDFGAARDQIGRKSKGLTSIVTPGYAPLEQYHTDGNQGPWTDIYAMGAILYQAVSGDLPPEAPARIRNDSCRPAAEIGAGRFSAAFLEAIDWALVVDEEARPQSVEDWREALAGAGHVPGPVAAPGDFGDRTMLAGEAPAPASAGRQQPKKSGAAKWVAAAVVVAMLAGGGWYAFQDEIMELAGGATDDGAKPAETADRSKSPAEPAKGKTESAAEQPKEKPAAEPAKPAATKPAETPKPPEKKAAEPTPVVVPAPAKPEPKPPQTAEKPPEPAPKAPDPTPKAPEPAKKTVEPQPAAPPQKAAIPPARRKVKLVVCPWLLPTLNARVPVKDCSSVSGLVNFVLENKKTGEGGSWRSRDQRFSGTVVPVQTYVRPDGIPCRRFSQTFTAKGQTRRAEGTACRNRNTAEWKLVL